MDRGRGELVEKTARIIPDEVIKLERGDRKVFWIIP
jgi:hypothetical protein